MYVARRAPPEKNQDDVHESDASENIEGNLNQL